MKFRKYIGMILVAVIVVSVMALSVSAAAFISNADLTVVVPVTGSTAGKTVNIGASTDFEVAAVMWKDVDENRVLADGEAFKAGHVYMIGISVRSTGGKVFSEERTTVTVNGGATEWFVEGSAVTGEVAVIYHTFPRTTIAYVTNLPISDVGVPVVGENPDWDAISDWDGARITAMGWQCVETEKTVFSNSDQSVKDEFIFKAGYTYKVAIAVEIKDGYELYEYFSVSVNGEQTNGSWTQKGKTAVVEYTFPKLPEEATRTPGDVNGDTKVNLTDVSLILKYIAKWNVSIDPFAADVNGDVKINLADAARILQYIAKWDVELK
ncbi:MAG: hypothetical protein E7578_06615 [Ruminococcaceae bacterium]|nr:hypothetical protein [Oscillospiraceae bacterium]